MKARVVNLRICTGPDCTGGPAKHLVAQHASVDVVRGTATAISYAWGALDRSKRRVGHYESGDPLEMELGDEWDVSDFQTALHDLCTGDGDTGTRHFIWIDQLCIVQTDDEEIRTTLTKIPDIYRSFNVVVLMPGAICQCQVDLGNDVRHFHSSAHQFDVLQDGEIVRSSQTLCQHPSDWYARLVSTPFPTVRCLNNMAFNQCFSRVWTRQELLYATEVRMKWVSNEPISCVMVPSAEIPAVSESKLKTPSDIETLHPITQHYFRLKIAELQSEVEPTQQAMQDLLASIAGLARAETVYAWHNVYETVREWGIFHANYGEESSAYWLPDAIRKLQFMMQQLICGDVIKDIHFSKDDKLSSEVQLRRFLTMFGQIRRSSRAATQAQDYVVAIWADCPGYQLPQSFKKMPMSDLLQDAVDQLLTNHSWSFLATCPAGLLTDSPITSAWIPSKLLGSVEATSCEMVYSSIVLSCESPISLKLLAPSTDLRPAVVAKVAWRTNSPSEIIEKFLFSICAWALDPSLAVMRHEHNNIQHGEWGLQQQHKTVLKDRLMFLLCNMVATASDVCYEDRDLRKYILLGNAIKEDGLPYELAGDLNSCRAIASEVDHETLIETIFDIVCIALRIDSSKAKQNDLVLTFKPGGDDLERPSMLGLGREDFGLDKAATSTFYASNTDIGNTVDAAVYEASAINGSGNFVKYRVVGAWVASQDLGVPGIAGIMDSETGDSIII